MKHLHASLSSVLPLLLGLGWLAACRSPEPQALADPVGGQGPQLEAIAAFETADSVFGYLLQRYDEDGDGAVAAGEYTRHDGQFARWDLDADGRLTEQDWSSGDLRVGEQIDAMQRLDVLGRYFQTDEDGLEVLTLEELARAFDEYQGSEGTDEELTRQEFRSRSGAREVELPGDGSMMMQSYVGGGGGWRRLTRGFDADRSKTLSLQELSAVFEELDVRELRFDQVRYDDGAPGARFAERDYEAGLVPGSEVPDLTLSPLHGGPPVNLRSVAAERPVALIFGSYT